MSRPPRRGLLDRLLGVVRLPSPPIEGGRPRVSMPLIRSLESGEVRRFARQLRVGRSRDNDLVLARDTVSTFHAYVEWREDGFYLRDLGSRNGTALDGRRVTDWQRLAVGQVVSFGPDARWTVDDLVPPSPKTAEELEVQRGPVGLTTAEAGHTTHRFAHLRLELTQRGEFGDITVHDGRRKVRFTEQELRFALLWVLADARVQEATGDGWVDDDALRSAVWGRRAAENQASSTLAKLIHDTRTMLSTEGVNALFIEKRRGRTRVRLTAEQITLL